MKLRGKVYDGKPCIHGHGTKRRVGSNRCVVCHAIISKRVYDNDPERRKVTAKRWHDANVERSKIAARQWRVNNLEKYKAYNIAYRQINADKIKARVKAWSVANAARYKSVAKKWRLANADRLREISKRWRAANPERVRQIGRNSKNKNPEKLREAGKAWRLANIDRLRIAWRARHARKRGAEGMFSKPDIDALLKKQNFKCVGCEADFHVVPYTIDHIVPLSRKGANWPSNLQLMCSFCNDSKGSKLMSEWQGAA